MKKFFLLAILAIFAISCSKKVDVNGKVTGGSPMERVEFIDESGISTLPLVNLAVSPTGEFKGSFEAPKNGMYVITYARNFGFLYLKKGQSVNISGNAMTFPQEMVITGDAKKNNDFMKDNEKFLKDYATKVNMQQVMQQKEPDFVKSMQKIYDDISKHITESASKTGADADALQLKRDELSSVLLPILGQYEMSQKMMGNNLSYKPSQQIADFEKKLTENNDRMVESLPNYRKYIIEFKLGQDFQKFAGNLQPGSQISEVFAKFLKTRKDLSQVTKDYLLAYISSQELKLGDAAGAEKVVKVTNANISDATIKKEIENLAKVVGGDKEGSLLPSVSLETQAGKTANLTDLKGKPTLVMLYASWNPGVSETTPVLKEVVNFYKSKMNFAYINLDDTKEQFQKTSKAMFTGLAGTSYYAEGGMNSELAKKMGIYGFKLPGFIILDKDGKTVGKYFKNLGEQDFVMAMDKVSGLKAPTVDPRVQLQVGADALKAQQMQQQAQAQQQQQAQPAPAGK